VEEGGDITLGRVGPVMLVRREGESFVALLKRLDRSIAKAREQEISIDEVNG